MPVRLPSFPSPGGDPESRNLPEPSFNPQYFETAAAQRWFVPQNTVNLPLSYYPYPSAGPQAPVYLNITPQGYPAAVPIQPLYQPGTRIVERERRARTPEVIDLRGQQPRSSSSRSHSRSPIRRHHHRHSQYHDSDSDSDFGSTARTLYSFTPSRTSPSSSKGLGTISGDEEPKDGAKTEASLDSTEAPSVSHVFESRYVGDGAAEGHHAAILSAVDDKKVKYKPLFRWLHIKPHKTRSMLDFEHFSSEVFRIENLTIAEKKAMAKMFSKLRKDYIRPMQFSDGRDVHRMKPVFLREEIPADSGNKGTQTRSIRWIALPYFSLEPYSGLEAGAGSASAVPAPTLLQSQFSHVAKSRDMRQAVCGIRDNRQRELCLHVSQLWCLVLDNVLIITYSTLPDHAFPGEFVTKTPGPLDALVGAAGTRKILVYFGTCVMWPIPLDECQTWFALMSQFREFWPQRLELVHNKRKITAKDWPSIWHRALHINSSIMLELHFSTRLWPPQRGRLLPDIPDKGKKSVQRSAGAPTDALPSNTAGEDEATIAAVEVTDEGLANVNLKVFAIFTYLSGASTLDSDVIDEDAILEKLVEIDTWLRQMPSFSDAKAYKSCSKDTRVSVRHYLEKKAAELSSVASKSQQDELEQREFEDKIDIFNAADTIFVFFFPINFDGPTVREYWGAIQTIISDKLEGQRQYRDSIASIRHQLRTQALNLTQLSEILSHAYGADRAHITVPNEIINTWINLILGLVSSQRDSEHAERLIDDARLSAAEGARTIISSLSSRSLMENSVVLPLEIFSLISLNLIQGIPNVLDHHSDTEKSSNNIAQIYHNRLDEIQADLSNKPSDRANEENLKLVDEEIHAIKQTISQQESIFSDLLRNATSNTTSRERPGDYSSGRWSELAPDVRDRSRITSYEEPSSRRRYYSETETRTRTRERSDRAHVTFENRAPEPPGIEVYENPMVFDPVREDALFKLSPTDPGGYRKLLLEECSLKIALLQDEFHQLDLRCSDMKVDSQYKVDTTRFRQDKAIYAFTIVTIIFLPLGAISSIFGMNTADIRVMENGQWIYWATALPVTLAVILLGSIWTGELSNFFRWASWGLRSWFLRRMAGDREKGRKMVDERPETWEERGLPSYVRPLRQSDLAPRFTIVERERVVQDDDSIRGHYHRYR